MGGAGHKGAHEIHLWDRDSGRLNKILEGPKDPCADLDVSTNRWIDQSVGEVRLTFEVGW